MQEVLCVCQWVYNKALKTRKNTWEEHREPISGYDTIKMIPEWRKENNSLDAVYAQVIQNVCVRVDRAFRGFFYRIKAGKKPGYPRYKGIGWYKSFTYPQNGFKLINNNKLRLSKIGDVKIKLHRQIGGVVKTLTIKKDNLGNWWALFSCEIEKKSLQRVPDVVGVDLGLNVFATLSTGEHIENPRFFRQNEHSLAKIQNRILKHEKGTTEYERQQKIARLIHRRIVNQRTNFLHQISRRLVNEFQLIVFEDLDIRNMQKNNFSGLNKSIADASWYQMRKYMEYKAESAGRTFIAVDPRGTSQKCSDCGEIVKKDLSTRVHSCPNCKLTIDRDLNSSYNILALGLQSNRQKRKKPHTLKAE